MLFGGGQNNLNNKKFSIRTFLTHLRYDDYFEDNKQIHCVAVFPIPYIAKMRFEMKRVKKL
jgi:hypothetical protein